MNDFVDAADPGAVEAVLRSAIAAIGVDAVLTQLTSVPDLQVLPGRPGGLFRAATPARVGYGDRRLSVDSRGASLDHIVGGIVLASDPVGRTALPGALSALVCRSLQMSGAYDDVSVLLTALRDAVAAAG